MVVRVVLAPHFAVDRPRSARYSKEGGRKHNGLSHRQRQRGTSRASDGFRSPISEVAPPQFLSGRIPVMLTVLSS